MIREMGHNIPSNNAPNSGMSLLRRCAGYLAIAKKNAGNSQIARKYNIQKYKHIHTTFASFLNLAPSPFRRGLG